MNDGIIHNKTSTYHLERIELKLNHYGLAKALIDAGLVPQGFQIEFACFDDIHTSLLEISLRKETPTQTG